MNEVKQQRRFCTSCGSELIPGNAFCTNCGAKVIVYDNEPQSKVTYSKPETNQAVNNKTITYNTRDVKESNYKIGIIIGGVLVGAALITGIVFAVPKLRSDNKEQNAVTEMVIDDVHDDQNITEESTDVLSDGTDDSKEEKDVQELNEKNDESAIDSDGHDYKEIATEDNIATENNNATDNSDYILPDSDSVKLSKKDIENLSLREINYAKNEIYARRGRRFDSSELRNYFESKSWYKGTIDPVDFSDNMLSEVEKANVTLLKTMEFSMAPNGYQLDQ
ncbi:MAG: YARHG domain-containing protein [Lachnospiraceae bacterium]|nr:YARHG domain-containing protein [Lachnospiraceae bacterium]